MHIRLVLALTHVQFILKGIYANPREYEIYKTKVPFYTMRGSFQEPVAPADYCRKGLCPKGVRHISCNNTFWGENCPKSRAGVNMQEYIVSILEYHNDLRKLIQMKVDHLPKAKRLPPLRWDEELSVVAMRVTNFCNEIEAHNCVNVPRFLNVARNSGGFFFDEENIVTIFAFVFSDWTISYNFFKASYVHAFPANASKSTLELANIINQRVHKVGCGMLLDEKSEAGPLAHLTCLYNEKVRPGQQLYETDP